MTIGGNYNKAKSKKKKKEENRQISSYGEDKKSKRNDSRITEENVKDMSLGCHRNYFKNHNCIIRLPYMTLFFSFHMFVHFDISNRIIIFFSFNRGD